MAWKLILEGVDPVTFNVVASFMAEMLMLSAAYSLSQLYAVLISRYLRNGNKVNLQSMGRVPSDFLEATTVAQQTRYAWPAVLIAILFFSDYFTAIAFAGLDFTYVDSIGQPETVLNLHQQNPHFVYGVLGEPAENPKTHSKFEAILQGNIDPSTVLDDEMNYLAETETIVHSFMSAADSLARGDSPFLVRSQSIQDNPAFMTIGHQTSEPNSLPDDLKDLDATFVYAKDSFLAAIDKAIPLECADEPLQFTQQIGGDLSIEGAVPNCRYSAARESGLFGVPEQAMVTAYAHFDVDSVALHSSARPTRALTDSFSVPPNGRRLARDHVDVREGRLVYGFSGVTVGSSLRLNFGLAAMASGRAVQPTTKQLQSIPNSISDFFKREYAMTAQVLNCPSDPSGNTDSTSCFAVVNMECNDFGLLNQVNDWASTVFESTQCQLKQVEIVWTRNVVINNAVLASLSGVYGRNLKWTTTSVQKKRLLAIFALPSAIFALASLDMMESVEPKKSTTIDIVFILFMILPVVVCFVASIISLVERKRIVPIPDDGQKMFVLGKQFAKAQKDGGDTSAVGINQLQLNDEDVALDTKPELEVVNESESEHKGEGSTDDKSVEVTFSTIPTIDRQDLEVGSSKVGADELLMEKDDDDDSEEENWIDIGELNYDEHPLALCALTQKPHETEDDKEKTGFKLKELTLKESKTSKKEGFFSWLRPSGAGLQEMQTKIGATGTNTGGVNMSNPVAGVFTQADKGVQATAFTAGQGAAWHSAGTAAAVYTTSGSLAFSAATAVVAGAVLAANSEPIDNSANYTIVRTRSNFSVAPDVPDFPEGCFENGVALGSAVDAMFDGDNTTKSAVLDDRGPMEEWCVDYVSDFSYLFVRKSGLKELDLGSWNVSAGRDFSFMFFEADALPIGIDQWDISGATTLTGMLSNVGDYNNNTLESWDTSGVTDMSYLFASDSYSSSGSRSSQDTFRRRERVVGQNKDVNAPTNPYVKEEKGTTDPQDIPSQIRQKYKRRANTQKASRFSGDNMDKDTNRRRVNGEANAFFEQWDVSRVRNFQGLFYQYSGTTLDLSGWNTSSAEDMSYIFYETDVQELDVSTWDVSSVTTFAFSFSTFGGHSDDVSFPDLSLWKTSSALTLESMFEFCQYHTNETDFTNWDVGNVRSFKNMFQYNFNFEGEGLGLWNVSKAEDFESMFKESNVTEDLSNWKTGSATTMREMFFGAEFFNSSLALWDVGKVTDFSGMFYDNSIFESDLSQWKVGANSIAYMFAFCTRFDSDLSTWDVSAVTDFSEVFRGARSFNSPLNDWKVSQGEIFSDMFRQAILFNQTLDSWKVDNGVDFSFMFYQAESFDGLGLETWKLSSALSMFEMITFAYEFDVDLCPWWDTLSEDISLFNLPSFFETGCPFQGQTSTGRGLYMCHRCFETVSPTSMPTGAPSASPSLPAAELTILALAADFTNKTLSVIGSDQVTGSVNWNTDDFPEFTQVGQFREYTFSLPLEGLYKFEAVNFNDGTGLGGEGEIILNADGSEFHRVDLFTYGQDPVYTFEFAIPVANRPNQQPVSPPVGEPFRLLNVQE